MIIYKVIIITITMDPNVEDFISTCDIFTNREKALSYAYSKAVEYTKNYIDDDNNDYNDNVEYNNKYSKKHKKIIRKVVYSNDGNYVFGISDDRRWANYEIIIKEDKIDFESDSILTIHIGTNTHETKRDKKERKEREEREKLNEIKKELNEEKYNTLTFS